MFKKNKKLTSEVIIALWAFTLAIPSAAAYHHEPAFKEGDVFTYMLQYYANETAADPEWLWFSKSFSYPVMGQPVSILLDLRRERNNVKPEDVTKLGLQVHAASLPEGAPTGEEVDGLVTLLQPQPVNI